MSDTGSVPRIHKLSTSLANQIAAGEVIERPASVVKELLENSLDAAATEIDINIEKAGNRLVSVRDNGQGIYVDDLVLALDRHATSKLHTNSDLEHIVSLGFRGEALPSIASVSRLTIATRSAGSDKAWSVVCDQLCKPTAPNPVAHPIGTSVEVRDLFFNTPGRRKFLKSDKTEFLHIQTLIRRLALSRHGVRFHCHHNGNSVIYFPAIVEKPEQRIIDVCGKAFFRQTLSLDIDRDGMHLWGWVGKASTARSQSDRQYFFLNGRNVRDKHVNHAVRMAYQDQIYTGRYPSYVLYLDMDPAEVDVNVHPTKHEVRFREPRNVHDFIFSSLHKLITSTSNTVDGLPATNTTVGLYLDNRDGNASLDIRENTVQYAHPLRRISQEKAKSAKTYSFSGQTQLLCQGRFLIREAQEGPLLIDIHATREAVTIARLQKAFLGDDIRSRPLLVPVTLQVSESDVVLVVENSAVLGRFGFCIDHAGPESLLVRELPALLPYADALPLVMDVINILPGINEDNSPDLMVTVMASHANDGAVQILDEKAIEQLLEDIKWLEQASDRPQSRQLYRILDQASLTRLIQMDL
jgi:DNA mismatch repair protein MutL